MRVRGPHAGLRHRIAESRPPLPRAAEHHCLLRRAAWRGVWQLTGSPRQDYGAGPLQPPAEEGALHNERGGEELPATRHRIAGVPQLTRLLQALHQPAVWAGGGAEGADLTAGDGRGWGEGVYHAVCAGGELHLPDSPGARRKRPSVIHSPLLQEEPDVRSLLLHDFLADERRWLEAADGGRGGAAGGKKQHHIRGAEGLCREGDYPGPALLLPGGYSPAPGPHCKKTQDEAVSRDPRHVSGSREEGDGDAALRGEGSRGVVPVPGAE